MSSTVDDGVDESKERELVQPWHEQLTLRGLVASVVIGSIFSIIAMKITLTWTKVLAKLGISSAPFTKQENTMIQTCSVACYSIALGGGFASYLLAMNRKMFELSGGVERGREQSEYRLDDCFPVFSLFCRPIRLDSSSKNIDHRLQIDIS